MVNRHVTTREIAGIRRELTGAFGDVQELLATPSITIRRKGTAGAATVITSFTPVSIRLADLQAGSDGGNGPTGAVTRSGTVKAFAATVTAEIVIGDAFVWQGQPCQVTTVPMTNPLTGLVAFDFATTAKNRS